MSGLVAIIGLVVLLTIVIAIAIPFAILALVVGVIRRVSGEVPRPRGPSGDPAAEQLRYRFNRDEITEEEFEEGMRLLGYEKRRPWKPS